MLPQFLNLALALLALPALAAGCYLFGLALASRRSAPPAPGGPQLRFDIIVPAHNERANIAATVASLAAASWPTAQRRILVVADNCTDSTAELAAVAGAEVMERRDPRQMGKGYALAAAFQRRLDERWADALVVVDADTLVEPNLLQAFATRLARGARAVQADYGVRNPDAGWRPRLMSLAFTLFHRVRSLGRERLGLSCGLRGNGMCLSTGLLSQIPYTAFSLVEDVEFGLRLGEAGVRVWYADDARVRGEMVRTGWASLSQRQRWEGGRRALARRHGLPLLRRALRDRDRILADLAVDLMVPPFAQLVAFAVLGTAAAVGLSIVAGRAQLALWLWAFALAGLTGYLVRGWQLWGTGIGGVRTVLTAPAYLAWKLIRRATGSRPGGQWVRTERGG